MAVSPSSQSPTPKPSPRPAEWPRFRKYLARVSRSRSFLWKFAIGAILLGVGIGFLVTRLTPSGPYELGERVLALSGVDLGQENPENDDGTGNDNETNLGFAGQAQPDILPALAAELRNPAIHFYHVLYSVPVIAQHVHNVDPIRLNLVLASRFDPVQAKLATAYLGALGPHGGSAFADLEALADASPTPRYAHYVVGRVLYQRKQYRAAYEAFRAEAKNPDAYESRYWATQALAEIGDFATLKKLERDPDYADTITPYTQLRIATANRDWWGILRAVPLTQLDSYEPPVLALTLIAGACWALFFVHLGQVPSLWSRSAALCLIAFVLGFLSTTPTVYLVVLQDDILHFTAGHDLYRTFAYNFAGVGVREELCKLLLFAPLLPFLRRRDDELEVLIVAGFVGLGFAVEENAGYFLMSSSASATGRFLTANFFHVALTGLNGLALYRACTQGMRGLNDLMLVLPITIMAHGAYDALIDAPGIQGGGFYSMIVFILFAGFYFNRVHSLRSPAPSTISLTGAFVFGVSTLVAAVIVFQMAQLGFRAGAQSVWLELVGSFAVLFVFFREFNEPLTE